MSNVFIVPQKWQLDLLQNPSKNIQNTIDPEEWYQIVMFELFSPDDYENNSFMIFHSPEYKEAMMDIYGVENPMHHPEIKQKFLDTIRDPEYQKNKRPNLIAAFESSEAYQNRGSKISKTKKSKEWKETVGVASFEKKMKTQKDPERIKARREKNTHICELCGSSVYGLNNLKQHKNGAKCKKAQEAPIIYEIKETP